MRSATESDHVAVKRPRDISPDAVERRDGARWWLSFWFPLLFFLFTAGVLLLSWRAFLLNEASVRELETRVTTEQVQLRLQAWINTRISVVEQLAAVWVREFRDDPDDFTKTARNLIELYPGFQALNWIDKDWVIRTIVPQQSNEPALGKDLHLHPSPGVPAALKRAALDTVTTVTPVIDLLQGGLGFASYRRVKGKDGKILGYVNGVFRIDTLVDACLAESALRRRFRFELLDENGRVAYSHAFKPGFSPESGVVAVPVRIGDQAWELRMARNGGGSSEEGTAIAAAMLVCALLLAAILSIALYALIRRHEKYRRSVAAFRQVLEHFRNLVVRMDADGRVFYASPAYHRLLGREQPLEGHDALLFIHGGDRAAVSETREKLLQPPHLVLVDQKIVSTEAWHRLSWMLLAIPEEDDAPGQMVAVGREFDDEDGVSEDGSPPLDF